MTAFSNLPDYSAYGYKITDELGNVGHRWKTYLAEVMPKASVLCANNTKVGDKVVIKIFDFGNVSQGSFEKYFERELDNLSELNKKGIPRIPTQLDIIKIVKDPSQPDLVSECILVNSYIDAKHLHSKNLQPIIYEPNFVRDIAKSVLEILSEAESKADFMHGDIKPENILYTTTNGITEAYLIDLEGGRFGAGTTSGSSVVVGSYGFIAPEVSRGAKLPASDLYSLGVTLLCLLDGIATLVAGSEAYNGNEVNVDLVKNKVSKPFLEWLKKMVAQDASQRFVNAADALKDLPSNAVLVPEVKILIDGKEWSQSKKRIEFDARNSKGKTKTFTFTNSTPETILQGHWEVIPDSNDPNKPPYSPTNHAWISFGYQNSYQQFQGKKVEDKEHSVECQIIIDTKNLAPAQTFNRKIRLKLNTEQQFRDFTIEVKTAPTDNIRVPYKALFLLAITLTIITFVATTNVTSIVKGVENVSIQPIVEKTKTRISEIDDEIKSLESNLNKAQEERKQYPIITILILFCIFFLIAIAVTVRLSNSNLGLAVFLCCIIVVNGIGLTIKFFTPIVDSSISSGIQRITSEISGLKSLKQDYLQMLLNKNNELQYLAIQEYWNNNTLNINLIIGVAISLAAVLIYFAYSYLSRSGKYNIKNPILEILVLLLITSISVATGIGIQIGFNHWYMLLSTILPIGILTIMQIRYVAHISRTNKRQKEKIIN